MTLAEYVNEEIAGLMNRVGDASRATENDTSEEGIHQLRVSIRRLSECLRVFKNLFPHGAAKKVRKDLKAAMKLAGEARNHDIARDLMKRAKVAIDPSVTEGRERVAEHLSAVLQEWNRSDAVNGWRDLLHG
jgi:CHAD domain-containing protein